MKHGKRNTDDDSIDEDGWIIDDNIDLTQTVRFSGNQKGKMNARSNGPFRLTFHYFPDIISRRRPDQRNSPNK